jgi:hypothetical protein
MNADYQHYISSNQFTRETFYKARGPVDMESECVLVTSRSSHGRLSVDDSTPLGKGHCNLDLRMILW